MAAKQRAVLIVTGSIQTAEEIKQRVAEASGSRHEIRTLIFGNREECQRLFNPNGALTPGEIVIATVLASRGIDLKLVKPVLMKGGLHVIVTFPPPNKRVEVQVFGRAARNGQPGSGKMILFIDDVKLQLDDHYTSSDETIDDEQFETMRENNVKRQLKNFENEIYPFERLRSKLFDQMCAKMKDIREMAKDCCEAEYALVQFEECWAFWLNFEMERLRKEVKEQKKTTK